MVQSFSEACLLLSEAGEIRAINPAVAKLVGNIGQSIIGKNIAELLVDDTDKVSRYLKECAKNRAQVPGALIWRGNAEQNVPCLSYGNSLQSATSESAPLILLRCEPRTSVHNDFLALKRTLEELKESHEQLAAQAELLKAEIDERNRIEETLHEQAVMLELEIAERQMAQEELQEQAVILEEEIAERTQAQESLERAAAEWSAAMDATEDVIYLLDINRRLLRANKAFYAMIGMTPETAIGRHIAGIIHPNDSEPCPVCRAQDEKRDLVVILEADHKDNPFGKPMEISVKIVRDGKRTPTSISVTHHDLSHDRKLQEKLRDSEERYRQLIELSPDAIFIQCEEKIVFINEAGAALFGTSNSAELLSRPVLDFVHPESKELTKRRMYAANRGEKLPRIEARYLKLDGTPFYVEIVTATTTYQGKPATQVFARDITERKSLERQLHHSQKLEAVGQLAGGIAHDFNNILTVIGGYGSLLQLQIKSNDPRRDMVDHIVAASERATHLTRGLLTFSRKQEIQSQQANLNEILEDVGNFLRRIIGEDITLTTIIRENPINVLVDRSQFEQVLINLATNARDAMGKGGVLTIETAVQELDASFIHFHGYGTPGHFAVVMISDTGRGIDEETKGKIFEPFFTTKEVGKGTGLGLAIVYGIIKQHNGYINVYSEPGRGTTFRIYLPVIEDAQTAYTETTAAEYPLGGTETILVAEDDTRVQQLMESILRQFGYEIILAGDGQDAVEKFTVHRDRISLVLTDLIMPKKSGKEAYEAIKQLQPGIKVLFISGYTADIIHSRGDLDDGVELLMKPVDPLELARKVREILDR
jgi:PAS domain S-box-containing protein